MKITAVQLSAAFGDVPRNLIHTEKWIRKAAAEGADLILLPEFFTTGIGFAEKMLQAVYDNRTVQNQMQVWAKEYDVILGGSYIAFDGKNARNRFLLCFPDGSSFCHAKDLPTQFENCYYTVGDTAHILDTPVGSIGIALCWEMLRYDTVRRMTGKVDIVLAGSCWWDLPDGSPRARQPLREYNQQLAAQAPVQLAKLLRVPVIHASHCGKVTAWNFPSANFLQTRQLVGTTQVVSSAGDILACRPFSEGAGLVCHELVWNRADRRSYEYPPDYWIPHLPDTYLDAWNTLNPLGQQYYRDTALPNYQKLYQAASH